MEPFSHGGVLGFEGQAMTYVPGGACYRCVFSDVPKKNDVKSSAEVGIMGSIAGMLGTVQATEAIKYILKKGELLKDRLLIFDGLKMQFRTVPVRRSGGCSACRSRPE